MRIDLEIGDLRLGKIHFREILKTPKDRDGDERPLSRGLLCSCTQFVGLSQSRPTSRRACQSEPLDPDSGDPDLAKGWWETTDSGVVGSEAWEAWDGGEGYTKICTGLRCRRLETLQ